MNTFLRTPAVILLASIGLSACKTIPDDASAVQPFDKERYLGKWHEIARFDLRFEKDLDNTTAEYSLNDDGTIKVLNRGHNTVTDEWKEAEGMAKFVGKDDVAMLKVSFFGPFYGGYNVIALDADYQHALVCGNNLNYFWILARTPSIPEDVKASYLKKAQAVGFDTDKLLWVNHDQD